MRISPLLLAAPLALTGCDTLSVNGVGPPSATGKPSTVITRPGDFTPVTAGYSIAQLADVESTTGVVIFRKPDALTNNLYLSVGPPLPQVTLDNTVGGVTPQLGAAPALNTGGLGLPQPDDPAAAGVADSPVHAVDAAAVAAQEAARVTAAVVWYAGITPGKDGKIGTADDLWGAWHSVEVKPLFQVVNVELPGTANGGGWMIQVQFVSQAHPKVSPADWTGRPVYGGLK